MYSTINSIINNVLKLGPYYCFYNVIVCLTVSNGVEYMKSPIIQHYSIYLLIQYTVFLIHYFIIDKSHRSIRHTLYAIRHALYATPHTPYLKHCNLMVARSGRPLQSDTRIVRGGLSVLCVELRSDFHLGHK